MYVYNTISIPINLNSICFLAAHSMQENDVYPDVKEYQFNAFKSPSKQEMAIGKTSTVL